MLIALASVKGSPGVTAFTVALAASWPIAARRLIVECDPAGGDLAHRFGLRPTPGLLSLAAAARGSAEPEVLWNHAQPLPGGTQIVSGPPGSHQARAALGVLTAPGSPVYGAGRESGVAIFVDCGRLDPGSPAEPVIGHADVLLLLSGTHSDELAHLAVRIHELGRAATRPCLVLTGDGHPTAEVERELGIPVMARIPHDPVTARTGHGIPGRHRKGGLVRAAGIIARVLLDDTIPTQAAALPHPPAAGSQIPGVPPQQVQMSGVRVAPPELLHNGVVLRKDASS
ncbi:carbon monoxide dehydrogenase maturation protein [Amycolatopsis sp. WQ 127309]|uniref:MinD/ParA family ATP-binding protein n=1 Tax=Amycolatopsis sp. WQ 127309 TaxID=2932773 RepID=UPI001FF1B1D2|nr:carbon monoxide dehydrogenase maturation protein [Amycolatopsis sp. WQ 127309]UOZ03398.1 carbon monoxide dehydrogenase maturation protein [Amycolatopsis sp. WQ 127309]